MTPAAGSTAIDKDWPIRAYPRGFVELTSAFDGKRISLPALAFVFNEFVGPRKSPVGGMEFETRSTAVSAYGDDDVYHFAESYDEVVAKLVVACAGGSA